MKITIKRLKEIIREQIKEYSVSAVTSGGGRHSKGGKARTAKSGYEKQITLHKRTEP